MSERGLVNVSNEMNTSAFTTNQGTNSIAVKHGCAFKSPRAEIE